MKAVMLITTFLISVNISYSQYYYNDIITTNQTNRQYLLLKHNHIQRVSAKSYEADGQETEDFMLEQTISANGTEITTTAEHPSTGRSVSTSYYTNDKISKTIDSVDRIKSTITYAYDSDQIKSITTVTEDAFMNTSSKEVHQWFLQSGQPVQMLLIKDGRDTTVVDFVKDEEGNIGEEYWKKKGRKIESFFYYYNDQRKLTDIVRYNAKARRLLPDFLFSYNDDALIQLTQIPQGSDNYIIWKYTYSPNGLKQQELVLNKQKQPIGSIAYTYR